MLPELGHFLLMLAMGVCMVCAPLMLVGAARQRLAWIGLARPAAVLVWALVMGAFLILAWGFYENDFSILYVSQHSNTKLPTIYRLSAVWGGHEGSLLLWMLMLVSWTAAVALFSRQLPDALVARVVGVLMAVGVGFLAFMLLTSTPFARLLPAATEGKDLNPLLQDPGLIIHPPMLYMGYVGFAVPYAFAIAALLSGRLDAAWARWSRPWTVAAWIFLTFGIALGSWWAYYELGWGGWWFWDPVENASFLPWLVGTALIHSLAVTEKRGLFRHWTLILAITAFAMSLLGTFLVRSGVLTSVHAFASDPKRGVFILIFLCVVVGTSFSLFAWRASKVRSEGQFQLLSRETLLLVNNVLLTTAAAAVLLGTLYPLIIDSLGLGKLSVGPPYFNAVFAPLMMVLLFFMAPGLRSRWKGHDWRALVRELRPEAVGAVALGVLLPFALGEWSGLVALGLGLSAWVGLATAMAIVRQLRTPQGLRAPAAWWGMHLAHLGMAVCVTGVTCVKAYEQEKDVRMAVGDTVSVGGYDFRFLGVESRPGPNYVADVGRVELSQGGRVLRELRPEKRKYLSSSMPMTEAAIDTGLTRDVYVSLGERLVNDVPGAWAVRVYYKPFVTWIWGGCLLMGLGGLVSVLDRRYRKRQAARGAVPAGAATT